MYSAGDWQGASRVEEQYQEGEKRMRQEGNRRKFDGWFAGFWQPARQGLAQAIDDVGLVYHEMGTAIHSDEDGMTS